MTDEFAHVLDRGNSRQPLWCQVLDDLRRRVVEREFVDAVPGELVLSAQYEVSRHTIREALRVLRDEGTVTASRGRSSLLSTAVHRPLGAMCSLAAAIEATGLRHRSVVCSVGVRVESRIAMMLGRERSERLVRIERLLLVGDVAVAIDRVWLPKDLAEPLLDADLTETVLDEQYARLCGLAVTGGRERILPVLPTASERSMLDTDKGVAAFAVERLGLAEGKPVEWRRTLLRSDWVTLTAELSDRGSYRVVLGAGPDGAGVTPPSANLRAQPADGSSRPSSRAVS